MELIAFFKEAPESLLALFTTRGYNEKGPVMGQEESLTKMESGWHLDLGALPVSSNCEK